MNLLSRDAQVESGFRELSRRAFERRSFSRFDFQNWISLRLSGQFLSIIWRLTSRGKATISCAQSRCWQIFTRPIFRRTYSRSIGQRCETFPDVWSVISTNKSATKGSGSDNEVATCFRATAVSQKKKKKKRSSRPVGCDGFHLCFMRFWCAPMNGSVLKENK